MIETTYQIDLPALALMRQYQIESIFDAYYAATALNQVPDHTIISTDEVFDAIPGIKRIDPHKLSSINFPLKRLEGRSIHAGKD